LKVLHINTSDIHGGAAIAANKIHRALMNIGADSTLFVQKASGNIPNTRESDGSRSWIKRQFLPYLDVLPSKFYPLKQPLLFSTNWYPSRKIVDEINSLKPDIVHLHWIARGFIRIEDIARIEAPIVWTLHDNWAFTGGCHILGSCTNYQKECGKCFRLGSRKKLDLSYCNFRRKQRTFENKTGIAFIAPSEWMAQAAKRSSIAGDSSVRTIPNPIDISTFRQLQTNVGISNGMRIILFGASTFDSNKGADLFFAALKLLSSHPVTLKVIVFGGEKNRCMR
jgi:glycosyltransferase involved in cell wall biosynthesis